MRKTIVISIHPIHLSKILKREKIFEYRRLAAKSDIDSILIYETAPVSKVVALAHVKEVLSLPLAELWESTKNGGGIDEDFFYSYFHGKEIGYAYQIDYVMPLEKPLSLSQIGLEAAPQSYAYYRGKKKFHFASGYSKTPS